MTITGAGHTGANSFLIPILLGQRWSRRTMLSIGALLWAHFTLFSLKRVGIVSSTCLKDEIILVKNTQRSDSQSYEQGEMYV